MRSKRHLFTLMISLIIHSRIRFHRFYNRPRWRKFDMCLYGDRKWFVTNASIVLFADVMTKKLSLLPAIFFRGNIPFISSLFLFIFFSIFHFISLLSRRAIEDIKVLSFHLLLFCLFSLPFLSDPLTDNQAQLSTKSTGGSCLNNSLDP